MAWTEQEYIEAVDGLQGELNAAIERAERAESRLAAALIVLAWVAESDYRPGEREQQRDAAQRLLAQWDGGQEGGEA